MFWWVTKSPRRVLFCWWINDDHKNKARKTGAAPRAGSSQLSRLGGDSWEEGGCCRALEASLGPSARVTSRPKRDGSVKTRTRYRFRVSSVREAADEWIMDKRHGCRNKRWDGSEMSGLLWESGYITWIFEVNIEVSGRWAGGPCIDQQGHHRAILRWQNHPKPRILSHCTFSVVPLEPYLTDFKFVFVQKLVGHGEVQNYRCDNPTFQRRRTLYDVFCVVHCRYSCTFKCRQDLFFPRMVRAASAWASHLWEGEEPTQTSRIHYSKVSC